MLFIDKKIGTIKGAVENMPTLIEVDKEGRRFHLRN